MGLGGVAGACVCEPVGLGGVAGACVCAPVGWCGVAGACVCSPEREGFLCALGCVCIGLVSLDEIVRCINTLIINYYYHVSVFCFPSLTCSCFFNSFTVRVGKLSLCWL